MVFDKIKFQQFVSNKAFLPDSYTAFKNKIGLTDGSYLTDSKEVVLAWPYKDCVLEGPDKRRGQAGRSVLERNAGARPNRSPVVAKGTRDFEDSDSNGEHEVAQITHLENLLIKGNNLLALHTLKKTYGGKIDVIYIDPPYNPESKSNTFCYNNTFNRSSAGSRLSKTASTSPDFC